MFPVGNQVEEKVGKKNRYFIQMEDDSLTKADTARRAGTIAQANLTFLLLALTRGTIMSQRNPFADFRTFFAKISAWLKRARY